MKIQYIIVILVLFLNAACGGTSIPYTPPPPTPTGMVLGDTFSATPVNVQYLTVIGSTAGSFTPSTQSGSVSGNPVEAISGTINNAFSYARLMDDTSVALVVASGSIPSGLVSYSGYAIMRVTDVPQSTNYDGTANARLDIRLNGAANGSLDLTAFSGTRQIGSATPTDVSSGRLTINGLSATAAGLTGGTSVTNVQFGDADFAGASFDVNGAFAGPDYVEVGGSLNITATNGIAQITFAATQ